MELFHLWSYWKGLGLFSDGKINNLEIEDILNLPENASNHLICSEELKIENEVDPIS
jgi:hypothetical protein